MATRGTYLINGSLNYNHWDNYPSGAALHLFEAIKKTGGFTLYDIIRGMPNLQSTGSIYDGRAEYHYKIEKDNIRCYSVGWEKDELKYESGGNIIDWINSNLELEPTDKKENFTLVEYKGRYMTLKEAKKMLRIDFKNAVKWLGQGMIGNSSGAFCDVFMAANKAKINIDSYKKKYLKLYVPIFVKSYNHNNSDLFNSYVNK